MFQRVIFPWAMGTRQSLLHIEMDLFATRIILSKANSIYSFSISSTIRLLYEFIVHKRRNL